MIMLYNYAKGHIIKLSPNLNCRLAHLPSISGESFFSVAGDQDRDSQLTNIGSKRLRYAQF